MDTSLNNIWLPPLQGSILTWIGGVIFVLFFSSLALLCLRIFFKKKGKAKILTAFCFMFGAFTLSCVIAIAMDDPFVVNAEFGVSFLDFASALLSIISIIAMICKAFGSPMKMRHFLIWMALFTLSFASVVTLGILGAKKAQEQLKER